VGGFMLISRSSMLCLKLSLMFDSRKISNILCVYIFLAISADYLKCVNTHALGNVLHRKTH